MLVLACSLGRCRAHGLGSLKARDRLTDVQLAIFNDRCSTIPRRSPKSRDRGRSLHGNSKRSSELTNVMLDLRSPLICGVLLGLLTAARRRSAYQCTSQLRRVCIQLSCLCSTTSLWSICTRPAPLDKRNYKYQMDCIVVLIVRNALQMSDVSCTWAFDWHQNR